MGTYSVHSESGSLIGDIEKEKTMKQSVLLVGIFTLALLSTSTLSAIAGETKSPVDGYDIHVHAPHMMADGTFGGPFHHYCKGISEKILQCLLFDSTDANAKLVAVEYFVSKDLTRKLPLIQWHRHFHDHKVEIATGRVQVLEPADKAKEIAEAAAKTDGVIYHLWQKGQEFPDGTVTFPQSVGHVFTRQEEK